MLWLYEKSVKNKIYFINLIASLFKNFLTFEFFGGLSIR